MGGGGEGIPVPEGRCSRSVIDWLHPMTVTTATARADENLRASGREADGSPEVDLVRSGD